MPVKEEYVRLPQFLLASSNLNNQVGSCTRFLRSFIEIRPFPVPSAPSRAHFCMRENSSTLMRTLTGPLEHEPQPPPLDLESLLPPDDWLTRSITSFRSRGIVDATVAKAARVLSARAHPSSRPKPQINRGSARVRISSICPAATALRPRISVTCCTCGGISPPTQRTVSRRPVLNRPPRHRP